MIKRVLASQKGASSVLVILLLLVLVVFGVAALTTALSGLRLGQKVSDWNESYYRLEGQAARCWAEIDAAVSRAAESGEPFEQALENELKQLNFETTLKDNAITYEVYSDGTRLHVTLALDMEHSPRLCPTEWYQIQSKS
ncbi:MAG: hypothetical protein GXW96_02190 [Christensenellaceae bacterium]|nr:hypothetical protein [Christensenellaceae bacterium]